MAINSEGGLNGHEVFHNHSQLEKDSASSTQEPIMERSNICSFEFPPSKRSDLVTAIDHTNLLVCSWALSLYRFHKGDETHFRWGHGCVGEPLGSTQELILSINESDLISSLLLAVDSALTKTSYRQSLRWYFYTDGTETSKIVSVDLFGLSQSKLNIFLRTKGLQLRLVEAKSGWSSLHLARRLLLPIILQALCTIFNVYLMTKPKLCLRSRDFVSRSWKIYGLGTASCPVPSMNVSMISYRSKVKLSQIVKLWSPGMAS